MGKFDKYVGKTQFVIDGEEIILDFQVEDKIKLMTIQESKAEKYPRLFALLKGVFKRSYPDESDVSIDAFLMKKFEMVFPELTIALGLITRDELDNTVKDMKAKGFQTGKEN